MHAPGGHLTRNRGGESTDNARRGTTLSEHRCSRGPAPVHPTSRAPKGATQLELTQSWNEHRLHKPPDHHRRRRSNPSGGRPPHHTEYKHTLRSGRNTEAPCMRHTHTHNCKRPHFLFKPLCIRNNTKRKRERDRQAKRPSNRQRANLVYEQTGATQATRAHTCTANQRPSRPSVAPEPNEQPPRRHDQSPKGALCSKSTPRLHTSKHPAKSRDKPDTQFGKPSLNPWSSRDRNAHPKGFNPFSRSVHEGGLTASICSTICFVCFVWGNYHSGSINSGVSRRDTQAPGIRRGGGRATELFGRCVPPGRSQPLPFGAGRAPMRRANGRRRCAVW